MSFDPDKTFAALIQSGDAWADAEAAAQLLEETRKTVLAKLMSESQATTVGAREMLALANQEYIDFVAGMVSARKAANKALVRYKSAGVLAELRRSQESTRRAEMGMR